jgi:hypothetical protein
VRQCDCRKEQEEVGLAVQANAPSAPSLVQQLEHPP